MTTPEPTLTISGRRGAGKVRLPVRSLPFPDHQGNSPNTWKTAKVVAMKHLLLVSTALLLAPLALHAAELTLNSPLDFQVVQRATPGTGLLRIGGELAEDLPAAETAIEARLLGEKAETPG